MDKIDFDNAKNIYDKALEITRRQYDDAQKSTDGRVIFNFSEKLHENAASITGDHKYDLPTVLSVLMYNKPKKDEVYNWEEIQNTLKLELPIEDKLDIIDKLYPVHLTILGKQQREGKLVWIKVKLREIGKTFELGIRRT